MHTMDILKKCRMSLKNSSVDKIDKTGGFQTFCFFVLLPEIDIVVTPLTSAVSEQFMSNKEKCIQN